MTKDIARSGEVVAGIALAGLGAYIFLQARQWAYLDDSGPGPGFFPSWYGAAIVVLSAVLVVNKIRQAAVERDPPNWNDIGRALLAWLAFAVIGSLMEPLGFATSFGILVLVLVRFIFVRPWPIALAVAFICPIAFKLIFQLGLGVPLPAGPGGF